MTPSFLFAVETTEAKSDRTRAFEPQASLRNIFSIVSSGYPDASADLGDNVSALAAFVEHALDPRELTTDTVRPLAYIVDHVFGQLHATTYAA